MASGRLTSVELVEFYLARIAAYDTAGPRLKALLFVNPAARDEAAAAGGMDIRPVNASDAPASAAAELYGPRTARWESTVDMVQVRTGHSAALLPDGTVLVAGGISVRGSYSGETPSHNTGWLYSAEVYDPGSGR